MELLSDSSGSCSGRGIGSSDGRICECTSCSGRMSGRVSLDAFQHLQ